MTLISLKIAQDGNSSSKKETLAKTSRKLGLFGNFVKGQSLKQTLAKGKKDILKYLKAKQIPVKKNISTRAMGNIVKDYVKDRFRINPKKFEVVRDLITGLYNVSQKRAKQEV